MYQALKPQPPSKKPVYNNEWTETTAQIVRVVSFVAIFATVALLIMFFQEIVNGIKFLWQLW